MIINSLLDTDLYKFTMQQVVYHHFPQAEEVEYHFKCRTENVDLTPYVKEIENEINHLCSLRFKEDELNYLRSLRYMKSDFVDFLSLLQLKTKYVEIKKVGQTEIDVVIKGPWLYTILFEVPVLAIINEVYFRNQIHDWQQLKTEGMKRLMGKIDLVRGLDNNQSFFYSDFGTRRRFSVDWQDYVLNVLKSADPIHFTGTSNVYFAKKYSLTPIGTMAHEYLQACQSLGPRLRDSQKFALEKWVQEYRGDLGIALTDVVGIDAFLKDFDLYFCKLFDGVRHDSGDPIDWGRKMLNHYKKYKINSKEKKLVFSDSLTFPKAIEIYNEFHDKTQVFFGIGTNLTNDLGIKPLNIVIKMTACNGQPVAKVSDSPGKTMCKDSNYINYLKSTFEIPDNPFDLKHIKPLKP